VSKPRIAVVGVGHLGKIHARLLAQSDIAELVAVVDPHPETRDAVAAQHQVESYSSHDALFGRIDGVVVASPTRYHHGIVCDLLSHQIPVLVEKPIAATVAEAEEMVELAARAGVVLQVGHVERFNPAWQAAVPWTAKPRLIETRRVAPFSCRSTDVGVVLDLMIHDLDLVLSIANSEVVDVQASGFSVITNHEDVAEVRLAFADGATARLHASRVNPCSERRANIWTAEGLVEIDLHAKKLRRQIVGPLVRSGSLRIVGTAELTSAQIASEHLVSQELTIEDANAISLEHSDFLRAISTGHPPIVSGESGLKALALADRILDQLEAESRPSIVRPLQWDVPQLPQRRAG
jgi:predicted dehydrogenase